jgi:putative transposase
LYLHGLSSSDFGPVLEQFLGSDQGLSAATITRLTTQWQDEATMFNKRSLNETDYVYVWVDGIHLKVGLEQDKVCLLVMIGVRADGTKQLIALADGFRESTESWADLLRSCKRRGMAAPVLAVGDGALGFWAAVREVFPQTREQRCWFHKIANVLNALPKSAQPGAKAALTEIWNAEDKTHARAAAKGFAADYGVKWPKAAAKITDDLDVLLAFYDYPAEHWIHLRTTNPIESTFATVRLRQRVTKGPGHRAAGLAMAFKLIEAAQTRWRMVNAPHLVALVRAGATFNNGKLVERPESQDQQAGGRLAA